MTINGGTLQTVAGGLGTTGTINFGGGILQYAAATTTDFSSRISTANNQAFNIDTNGNNVTFATQLGGAPVNGNSLSKFGNGVLFMTAPLAYDGTTFVAGGVLSVGNGTATPVTAPSLLTRPIVLGGGTFAVNRPAAEINQIGSNISGAGFLAVDQSTLQPTVALNLPGVTLTFGSTNAITTTGTFDLSNLSATFGSLLVQDNSAAFNSLLIGSGKSLTLTNGITMGAVTGANPFTSKLAVSGPGFMSVTGGTIQIGVAQTTVNAANNDQPTLDLPP